jgi:hypothetical protein
VGPLEIAFVSGLTDPFDHCDTAIQALGQVDVSSLLDLQSASHVLGVQHFLDQLEVHQARVLAF